MKISQAVLLLASRSTAEKVDVDITRELYLSPTEDGLRTGSLNFSSPGDFGSYVACGL